MPFIILSDSSKVEVDPIDFLLHGMYCWKNRDGRGYAYRSKGNKSIYLHLEIAKDMRLLGPLIDHKDQNKRNCKRENLRSATKSQQMANCDPRSTNTTGFKGVSFNKKINKYVAQIRPNGKTTHLGCFETAEEAGKAYDLAAKKYFGEFACLNG